MPINFKQRMEAAKQQKKSPKQQPSAGPVTKAPADQPAVVTKQAVTQQQRQQQEPKLKPEFLINTEDPLKSYCWRSACPRLLITFLHGQQRWDCQRESWSVDKDGNKVLLETIFAAIPEKTRINQCSIKQERMGVTWGDERMGRGFRVAF